MSATKQRQNQVAQILSEKCDVLTEVCSASQAVPVPTATQKATWYQGKTVLLKLGKPNATLPRLVRMYMPALPFNHTLPFAFRTT